ncbi:hypothetical protein QVD17_24373 [Tagetes erecta]|uniref:Reverse transcriptase domain, Reverse transcriptase zinc-binding domain protein n=1 Tax=Tagetes erecta TaxID=13708 RepID=A0AAD8KFJ9_TARER|nr:hypothetical protein QVD17_24373 [Tagetes erecta]
MTSNCKSLIEKVDRRIDDWMNKSLSFAGRLQLITSVISSMYTYWASVLVIPASTVKDLERKMKGFLWQKDENDRAKAKVAWTDVCLPKSEGGKDVSIWHDNQGVERKFSIHIVWETIRHRSPKIWKKVRSFTDLGHIEGIWDNIVRFLITRGKWESINSIIDRLVIGATSYYVWQERNARLFTSNKRNPNQISALILENVRLKLVSMEKKKRLMNGNTIKRWNLEQTEDNDGKWDSIP